jgi:hypothetical protein
LTIPINMSSVVTAVPSGLVQDWCIQQPWLMSLDDRQQCANSTRGTVESDFETICCDGQIVDARDGSPGGGPIDLADLVCCRVQGPQTGGILPLPTNAQTECGTGNAQGFLVTYTSASYGTSTTGDFVPTHTPYCLWMNTKSGMEAMMSVTVQAAVVTTLSSSSEGEMPTAYDGASTTIIQGGSSSTTAQSSSTTTSASSNSKVSSKKLYFLALLGLVMAIQRS